MTLHLAGKDTALVLARESMGDNPADWGRLAKEYVRACRPTALILGNEMDAYLLPVPSPSSWSMQPQEYREFVQEVLKALEEVRPRPLMIGGGCVSGQPDWWVDVNPRGLGLDGIDVHPYGKDPEDTRTLMRLYKRYRLPLYIYEWNRPWGEIQAYSSMLAQEQIRAGCFFCWSDGMVPDHGLLDADGNPKEEHTHLLMAAQASNL
jgi:hypothetical protein